MSNSVIFDSLGDGNCFFNSVAINLVLQMEDPSQEKKWLALFEKEAIRRYYHNLADTLLEDIQLYRAVPNPQKNPNLSPQQLLNRFKALFNVLKQNGQQDWTLTQEAMAKSLRHLVVSAVRISHGLDVLDKDEQMVKLSTLLEPRFDEALEGNLLTFDLDPKNTDNRLGESFFYKHPAFIKKMEAILNGITYDVEKSAYLETNPENPKAMPSLEFRSAFHKERIEAFKHWFYEEGGIQTFLDEERVGLAKNYAWTDQFPMYVLSSLLGLTFAYKANPEEIHVKNKISVLQGDQGWQIVRHGETVDDLPNPEETAIVYMFSKNQEHWKACLRLTDASAQAATHYAENTGRYDKPKQKPTVKPAYLLPADTFPETLSLFGGLLTALAAVWLLVPGSLLLSSAFFITTFIASAFTYQFLGDSLIQPSPLKQGDKNPVGPTRSESLCVEDFYDLGQPSPTLTHAFDDSKKQKEQEKVALEVQEKEKTLKF